MTKPTKATFIETARILKYNLGDTGDCHYTIRAIANDFAREYSNKNAAFNRVTFLLACGFSADEI